MTLGRWNLEVITPDKSTDAAIIQIIGKQPWASGFGGERDMSFDFETWEEAGAARLRLQENPLIPVIDMNIDDAKGWGDGES